MKVSKIIVLLMFFIITIFLFNLFIKWLKQKKIGQMIREEGPRNHFNKIGTPTMGGILIIINTIIFYILFLLITNSGFNHNKILLLIIPFLFYGLIGFIDDYLIIKKHKNEGLKPNIKFLFELIISTIYYFLYLELGYKNELNFFGTLIELGFIYGIFIMFFFTGLTNATNFTDGVDGLLGSVSITSFISIGIISYLKEEYEILYFSIIITFIILAFLFYNFPKAKVFMGDTGSLAIGGIICSMLILLKCEILIIFIGFIYLIEVLSVMLQVWYFKRSKGNRIFKMTPLHHHFELSGLNDIKIDLLFSLINIILAIIGIYMGVNIF